MKKLLPYVLVLIIVLIGAVYYMNGRQTGGVPVEALTEPRENSEAMVTVSLTFLNPIRPEYKDTYAFEVNLNTHSVDLDSYDLQEISYLRTKSGQIIKPVKWEEASGSGGHHRSGILLFPNTDDKLQNGGFDIIVEDIAGIDQRMFSW